MKTKKEILDLIETLTDDAQALSNLAEEEGREFSAEEQKQWNSLMDEDGELAQAQADLDHCEKLEAQKAKLALAKRAQRLEPFANVTITGNGNTPQPNVVHNRLGTLKAFKGQTAEQDAYNSGIWLKAIAGRMSNYPTESAEQRCRSLGWDINATATEGSPSGGGYLVPTPLSNAIIDVRALAGVSRQLCRVVPMTSDTLDIAKKTAGTTVYYPGEAGAVTASDQTWGAITLNAKKRAILSYVSQELVDDAIIAIVDDLASQMGLDLAIKEDSEWIAGDGTSTYGGVTGLKNAIGSAGIATAEANENLWAELDLEDFTAAMGLLDSKYWPRGVSWLCSAQFYYGCMLRVMAEAGGNTIQNLQSGDGRPQFLGAPVFFSSQCTTADADSTIHAYFGSFADSTLIGDRMGVMIKQSDQYAFNTDRLAIRATTRYDINVHDVGNASSPGAVVAVKTNAA